MLSVALKMALMQTAPALSCTRVSVLSNQCLFVCVCLSVCAWDSVHMYTCLCINTCISSGFGFERKTRDTAGGFDSAAFDAQMPTEELIL